MLEAHDDLGSVFCPECESDDYSCDGYDLYDNPKILELSERISNLEKRVYDLADEKYPDPLDIN